MESVKLFEIKDYASLQTALDGLCQLLAEWGVAQEKTFDCKLVACELVGNVLKYGEGKAGLQVRFLGECVQVKALSESFFELPENIACSGLYAESGRGLFLVDAVTVERKLTESGDILVKIKK